MSSSDCWLRNGTKARRALPCNHTAIVENKHTACCDPDDQCLTNGLCRDPAAPEIQNFVWFFGCTDRTFQDPACGNYCDKYNQERNNHLIWQCHEKDTWCCHTGDVPDIEYREGKPNISCCRDNPDLVFSAPIRNPYTIARASGSPFPAVTLMPSSTLALLNSTFRSEMASVTGSPSAISAPSPSPSAIAKDALTGWKLAVGLGLGLGLSTAAVVVWYTRRRNKIAKAKKAAAVTAARPAGEERREMTAQEIVEKESKERYEIQDREPPNEVVGDMYRAELSATSERAENRI